MIISIVKVGVPDVTCLIYEAKDGGPVEDCTKPDINLCRSSSRSQPVFRICCFLKIHHIQGLHMATSGGRGEAQLLGQEEFHKVLND